MKIFLLLACLISVHAKSFSAVLPPDTLYSYPCEKQTFWTIGGGDIRAWQLENGVITGGQVILSHPSGGHSLAYCGNEYQQTFFAGYVGGISYYNGTDWTLISNPNIFYQNYGGYNQFQYITNSTNQLLFFNGTSFTLINNEQFTVADIAVDTLGNAWYFTGEVSSMTTYLRVLNSAGTISATYTNPSINFTSAYGTFFMQDTLYIGFGSSSPNYANKLVPVLLNGNAFTLGTPIPFPVTGAAPVDIASCLGSRKSSLGVTNFEQPAAAFYPNPSAGTLTVTGNQIISTEICTVQGVKVKSFGAGTQELDISELPDGIYWVKIISGDKIRLEKLLLKR